MSMGTRSGRCQWELEVEDFNSSYKWKMSIVVRSRRCQWELEVEDVNSS